MICLDETKQNGKWWITCHYLRNLLYLFFSNYIMTVCSQTLFCIIQYINKNATEIMRHLICYIIPERVCSVVVCFRSCGTVWDMPHGLHQLHHLWNLPRAVYSKHSPLCRMQYFYFTGKSFFKCFVCVCPALILTENVGLIVFLSNPTFPSVIVGIRCLCLCH